MQVTMPGVDGMTDTDYPGNGRSIAVTSTGTTADSPMDPRFGRCAYFAVVDPTGKIEHVPNAARALGNGAGIQAAKQIIDMGIEAVITGDVGPNAFRVLSAAGVKIFAGASGTVAQAIEMLRRGDLRPVSSSTAPGHHGMGGGRWRGQG